MLPNLAALSGMSGMSGMYETSDGRLQIPVSSQTLEKNYSELLRIEREGGIKLFDVDARTVNLFPKRKDEVHVQVRVSIFGLTHEDTEFYLLNPMYVDFHAVGWNGLGRLYVDGSFGGLLRSEQTQSKLFDVLRSYRPTLRPGEPFRPITEKVAHAALLEAEEFLYEVFPKMKILREQNIDDWRAKNYEYLLYTRGILSAKDRDGKKILPRRV